MSLFKKYLMFDLVEKISENNNNIVKKKDLSNILVEIDKESEGEYVLTPVIEGVEGFETPRLKSVLNEFCIFNVIARIYNEDYIITEDGRDYIKKKTAELNSRHPQIYKEFSEIADKTIDEYFNTKE